jgi:hypothetical protein
MVPIPSASQEQCGSPNDILPKAALAAPMPTSVNTDLVNDSG